MCLRHCITVSYATSSLKKALHLTLCLEVFVQVGNIISANIYQAADAPLYRKGNRNLVIINAVVIAWFIFSKLYYVTKNKIRDRKWNAMSPEVSLKSMRADYIAY